MLRMALKNGEQIKLGNDIIIKSMTEGRCELAIDAPREVKIEKITTEKTERKSEIRTSVGLDGNNNFFA